MTPSSPVQVRVLALDGAMRSSVALTLDVLDTANSLRAAAGRDSAFEISVDSCDGASGGPDASCQNAPGGQALLVLPGLGMTNEADVRARLRRPDAVRAAGLVRAAAGAGVPVATSCSGTFLLASAGVLDGRRATTSWWLGPLLAQMHPAIVLDSEQIVVSDGPFTTAGAAMAQLDLMLTLIAAHADAPLAQQCARYLAFGPRQSQSPYMAVGLLAAGDDDVRASRSWALRRLSETLSVNDLAASVHLSPRTYARRVQTATGLAPARFLRRIRVERAAELFETTAIGAGAVAHAVGYADASALRRAMRQELGDRRHRAAVDPSSDRGRG